MGNSMIKVTTGKLEVVKYVWISTIILMIFFHMGTLGGNIDSIWDLESQTDVGSLGSCLLILLLANANHLME